MPQQEDIDVLRSLIERIQNPITPGISGRPYIVIPDEHKLENIEPYLRYPTRKTGDATFSRADSFISYINEQKTQASRLYVVSETKLKAVLDHHVPGGDQAGWGQHLALFILTQTPEWKTWTASNLKKMTQRDFATFIDDNSEDIASPHGGELLELIRTIKTSQQLELGGEIDERNDAKSASFVLVGNTKAGAKEEVELPAEFTLAISPYEGGEKLPVRARLRLEIAAPKFFLHYDLVKIQKIEREALEGIVKTVADAVEMEPWFGTP